MIYWEDENVYIKKIVIFYWSFAVKNKLFPFQNKLLMIISESTVKSYRKLLFDFQNVNFICQKD